LLLSQYLREHQQLRLPGLGSFYASGTTAVSDADTQPTLNVRFERKTINKAEEGLVEFIRQKTGKIRPLALADLDSYIESGLQLLNIGKPFYIEGIGTIMKTREGNYDFESRELVAVKEKEQVVSERAERPQRMHVVQPEKKKSVFDDEKYNPSTNPWQKIVVAALILGGLTAVVLGGYYLYSQNNGQADIRQNVMPPPLIDSTNNKPDSLDTKPVDSTASYAAGGFKFILETTNSKKRALRRYNQLKSYFIPIKMETADSVAYKLYFLITATPSDTTRIKDSLSRYYMSKVKIEL